MKVYKYVEEAVQNTEETGGECDKLVKTLFKKSLSIPAEPVWKTMVCIMCYVTVTGRILLSYNGLCLDGSKGISVLSVSFYIMDILLVINTLLITIGMALKSKYPDLPIIVKPKAILMLEFVSAVPLEVVTSYSKINCTLRLNRTLRIVSIVYLLRTRNQNISARFFIRTLFEFASYTLFMMLTAYAFYCNLQCHGYDKCNLPICLNKYLHTFSALVTMAGYEPTPDDLTFRILSVLISHLTFYYLSSATIAYLAIGYVNCFLNKINYTSCHLGITRFLKHMNAPKYFISKANEEFNLVWLMKRTKCYNLSIEGASEGSSFLHPSMYNELMIDIAWVSFKHSHLFRNSDFNYLRYLSNFIVLEYKLPGEYLYMKGDWKNKMIYIASGTVDILSNENHESAILSLCEGTVFGACSVFVSYQASHYIRCKTFCELHIIQKIDFLRSWLLWPAEFNRVKDIVRERYETSMTLQAQAMKMRNKIASRNEQEDPYTLLWVKNTLHRLMAVEMHLASRHEFQNIYLINEVDMEDFDRLMFHADYLSMLVISERHQGEMDSVFVRTHFPYIFQPDSALAIVWDVLVVILTIAAAFTLPYYAFVADDITAWESYHWFVIALMIVYVMDVLVQLLTATKNRHGVTTTYSATVRARIYTARFWADVGAVIPIDKFLCILSTQVNYKIKAFCHLNRLLKMYRIQNFFKRWDNHFNADQLIMRYIKLTCILVYTIFVVHCLLCYWERDQNFGESFYKSTLMISKNHVYNNQKEHKIFSPILNLFIELLRMVYLANIMSGFIMKNLDRVRTKETYFSILKVLGSKLSRVYGKRLHTLILHEWTENRCHRLHSQRETVCAMSQINYGELVHMQISQDLKEVKFFSNFPDELINEICEIMYIMTTPPHEVIICGGDIVDHISLIHKGTYNVFDQEGKSLEMSNKPKLINFMEAMMNIPTVQTVVSVTYCRIFYMEAKQLRALLTKYNESSNRLLFLLKHSVDIKSKMTTLAKQNHHKLMNNSRYTDRSYISQDIIPNFFVFKRSKTNHRVKYDYLMPFTRMYPFSFVRYFLMRRTINPQGDFIKKWEIARCCFAVLTGLLSFSIEILKIYPLVLLFLDLTALADIYVRLHTAYFDEDGLLITHPLATAKKYIKNAFLVDFIGILPTTIFEFYDGKLWDVFLRFNKLLQMYRYLYYCETFIRGKMHSADRFYGFMSIPIILVLALISSNIIVMQQCQTYIESGTVYLNCTPDNIFQPAEIVPPIPAMSAQLYAIYISCSILTNSGIQGFTIASENKPFIVVLCLIGCVLTSTFAGRYVILYSFVHAAFFKYQMSIKSLLSHLRYLKVSSVIQKQVVINFELKRKILSMHEVHGFLGKLSSPLRQDILYDLYGANLYEESVFQSKQISFYRNLLYYSKFDIIANGGYLGRANDIVSDIHIIYKGEVHVLSRLGEMENTLLAGSIFGNMTNRSMIRQGFSFLAATHVEYIHTSSKLFFKVLDYYPEIRSEYFHLRSRYMRYIVKPPSGELKKETLITLSRRKIIGLVYKKHGKRYLLMRFFVVVVVCYGGAILHLYQIAVQEYSSVLLGILYFFDVAFVLYYFIRYRTAFIDETGVYVTNLEAIKFRWESNKLLFIIMVISLIPFEIPFAFFNFLEPSTRYLLYGFARSNRYLRLTHVVLYFTRSRYRLDANIYFTRIGYMITWMSLALFTVTTLIIVPGSIFKQCTKPEIPNYKTIYNMTSTEKFRLYVTYLHLAANFLNLTSQTRSTVTSIGYTLLFTAIVILSLHLTYFCYSQIYSFFDQCSLVRVKYLDLLVRLDNFMRREDVSIALYDRVVKYVRNRWGNRGNDVYPALLDKAPRYLREDVLFNVFYSVMMAQPLFSGCSPDLLRQIAGFIRTRTFYRGDYIQFEGVNDDCMYLILRGEVIVQTEKEKVMTMKGGRAFGGLQAMDSKVRHEYTYFAGTDTIVGILNSKNWKGLLEFFPLDNIKILTTIRRKGMEDKSNSFLT